MSNQTLLSFFNLVLYKIDFKVDDVSVDSEQIDLEQIRKPDETVLSVIDSKSI